MIIIIMMMMMMMMMIGLLIFLWPSVEKDSHFLYDKLLKCPFESDQT